MAVLLGAREFRNQRDIHRLGSGWNILGRRDGMFKALWYEHTSQILPRVRLCPEAKMEF